MKTDKLIIESKVKFMSIIFVFGVILVLLSACTSTKIHLTDIDNFNEIYEDVCLMEIGQDDYSYTFIYEEDIHDAIEIVKKLEVEAEPVLEETVFDRDKSNYFYMRKKSGGYVKIFIDKDMKTVWMDRGDDYSYWWKDREDIESYTYKITNKKVLNALFEPLQAYFDEEEYKSKYLDVRVMKVLEDHIVVQEERLNENVFVLEDWYKALGDTYAISMETLHHENNKFVNGDKLRIEFGKIEGSKITEIKNIYYINELLYLKDYGNAQYYKDEQIEKAMNIEMREGFVDDRDRCAIWYMYCDDEEFLDVLATDKELSKKSYTIEDTLMVFTRVLPSRTMYGDEGKKATADSPYGIGGWSTIPRSYLE